MTEPVPSAQPQRSWWSRNWKWADRTLEVEVDGKPERIDLLAGPAERGAE